MKFHHTTALAISLISGLLLASEKDTKITPTKAGVLRTGDLLLVYEGANRTAARNVEFSSTKLMEYFVRKYCIKGEYYFSSYFTAKIHCGQEYNRLKTRKRINGEEVVRIEENKRVFIDFKSFKVNQVSNFIEVITAENNGKRLVALKILAKETDKIARTWTNNLIEIVKETKKEIVKNFPNSQNEFPFTQISARTAQEVEEVD